MPAQWKIWYTDGTTLLWSDVDAVDGSPLLIPVAKRVGVHSVVQSFQNNTMRETIEQYHYIFKRDENQWIGVGVDGLIDHMIADLPNSICVMNGRTSTTDTFWAIKEAAREDTDIVGGASLSQFPIEGGAPTDMNAIWRHVDPFYSSSGNPYDPVVWEFTEPARHRAYSTDVSEPPYYGEQRFYH